MAKRSKSESSSDAAAGVGWLSPRGVAREFMLEESTVHRLVESGLLRAVRFETELRISRAEVTKYCRRFSTTKPRARLRAVAAAAVLAVGAAVVTGALHAQSTPAPASFMVPYDGYLEDGGSPSEGQKHVTFRLYRTADGGTSVWEEVHAVALAAGRFSANLGATSSLDDVMRGIGSLYLEVSVDGDMNGVPVGSPVLLGGRQLFGSVPFARRGAPGKDFVVDGTASIAGGVSAGGRITGDGSAP